jgi:uncharacterized membrane protein
MARQPSSGRQPATTTDSPHRWKVQKQHMDTVIIIVALVVIVFCLVAIGVARSRSDRNSKSQVAAAREAYARDVESDRGDT